MKIATEKQKHYQPWENKEIAFDWDEKKKVSEKIISMKIIQKKTTEYFEKL